MGHVDKAAINPLKELYVEVKIDMNLGLANFQDLAKTFRNCKYCFYN